MHTWKSKTRDEGLRAPEFYVFPIDVIRAARNPDRVHPVRADAQNFQAATSNLEMSVRWIAFNTQVDPVSDTIGDPMNSIVWLVGAIVIILFALSFFGLR